MPRPKTSSGPSTPSQGVDFSRDRLVFRRSRTSLPAGASSSSNYANRIVPAADSTVIPLSPDIDNSNESENEVIPHHSSPRRSATSQNRQDSDGFIYRIFPAADSRLLPSSQNQAICNDNEHDAVIPPSPQRSSQLRRESFYHLSTVDRAEALRHDPAYPKIRRLTTQIGLGKRQLCQANRIMHHQAKKIHLLQKDIRASRPTGRRIQVVDESIETKKQPLLAERDHLLAEKATIDVRLRMVDQQLLLLDGLKSAHMTANGFSDPELNYISSVVQLFRGVGDVLRNKVIGGSHTPLHRLTADLLDPALDQDTGSALCSELVQLLFDSVPSQNINDVVHPARLCGRWIKMLLAGDRPVSPARTWPVFGFSERFGIRCTACQESSVVTRSSGLYVDFLLNSRPPQGSRKRQHFRIPRDVLRQRVSSRNNTIGMTSDGLDLSAFNYKFKCSGTCNIVLDHFEMENVQDLLIIRIPSPLDKGTVIQLDDEFESSGKRLRLRGFIVPIPISDQQSMVTFSFRSCQRYDSRHVRRCVNDQIELSWPKGGDPYTFPTRRYPQTPVACIYEASDIVWDVESILRHRFSGAGLDFLVKWVGLAAEDATWEPCDNLAGSPDVALEYCNLYPEIRNFVHWLPQQDYDRTEEAVIADAPILHAINPSQTTAPYDEQSYGQNAENPEMEHIDEIDPSQTTAAFAAESRNGQVAAMIDTQQLHDIAPSQTELSGNDNSPTFSFSDTYQPDDNMESAMFTPIDNEHSQELLICATDQNDLQIPPEPSFSQHVNPASETLSRSSESWSAGEDHNLMKLYSERNRPCWNWLAAELKTLYPSTRQWTRACVRSRYSVLSSGLQN